MKRVWSEARALRAESGWLVTLDGKPLRLPDGGELSVPQPMLAEAVAAEWQAAGLATGEMDYTDVPLTRLAGTAQRRIVPDPAPSAAAIAAYGETDLLCYRAATPPLLVARQTLAWDPWLDWSRTALGAALVVTTGVMHVRQHPAAIAALHRAVAAEHGWALAGLGILVPALGSLVLGLAVAREALEAADALELSRLDETYEIEQWGADDEQDRRRVNVARDVDEAARYLALVR